MLDENLDLDLLKRFAVVMLPNVSIISEAEARVFRRYVEDGGRLVVTGRSGLRGHHGETVRDSALAGLIGATVVRELDSTDNWVRFGAAEPGTPGATLAAAGRPDWPFLVRGPAVVYRATTATTIGELIEPHRTSRHTANRYSPDWPMSADKPVGPAILLNTVGRGTVLTFAASPDTATASDHHIVEARRLIAQAVRALNPTPRIRIDAPATVQAVVTDHPTERKLRVHLLGYNTPPQTTPSKDRPYALPMPIEDAPIFRVVIESSQPLKNVKALGESTRLERRGNRIEATVDDVHECLVLDY